MVNGPPTPPATTATELQDEARGQAVPSAAADPLVSQVITPQNKAEFQRFLTAVVDAISRANYDRLVRLAEEKEYTSLHDRQLTQLIVTSPLVLGYLILDRQSPARYALARLSDTLAAHPLPRGLLGLVVATMNREHANVYRQIEGLITLVNQPDFLDKDLGSILTTLLNSFRSSFRERTFELISKAYTSLSPSLACTYLGLSQERLVSVVEKYGWTYDPAAEVLYPKPLPKRQTEKETSTPEFSSLSTFHFVADSVARLEL